MPYAPPLKKDEKKKGGSKCIEDVNVASLMQWFSK